MAQKDGALSWSISALTTGESREVEQQVAGVSDDDVAALKAEIPMPTTVEVVKRQMHWRSERAAAVLKYVKAHPHSPDSGERPGNGGQTHG